jgi:hypothetical protein
MSGLFISVLILIVFALDLAIEWPFDRASLVMDIGFIVSALVLGYLSWTTHKELS